MKKWWFSYAASIVLSSFLLGIILWILYPLLSPNAASSLSPIPRFLSLFANPEVTTLDIWSPSTHTLGESTQKPAVFAKSALVYDLTSNKVLFEKNANSRLPMASLTKIMTAIVALENKKESDQYIVSPEDLVGEDSMGLTAGEVVTLKDLLYGLMLNSGNDAAEVLAHNYPLSRDAFVQAMNNKAQALGLQNTHFTNPSGLQGDGEQYTTAFDLVVVTRYALSNFPEFAEVVKTVEHTIPYTASHKYFYLYNETNLLTSYPGVKGVKTGFTPEAGLCLVTYLEYGGHQMIGVLLGSNNRRQEMKEMLDYSLRHLGINPPKHN